MALTLTTLSSDNFQRANAYPLGGLWVYDYTGADGLEIDSDLANAPVNQPGSPSNLTSGEQGYNYSLPNDHFVSITLAENALKSGAFIALGVRTDFVTRPFNTDGAYSVNLQLQGGGGNSITWYLYPQEGGAQADGSVTAHVGDVFTLAVVGTTAYVLQNSTILTSATVAGEYDGPGLPYTGMFMSNEGTGDESGFVSLYAVGSASVTSSGGGGGGGSYSSSLPFLGSVRVVASAPSGQAVPFIGTVTKISSAPAGLPNPYLGNVVAGTPSANDTNPALGQVVEVASAPAGDNDPFLGAVEGT